jgi:hypothetical protein
VSRKFKSIDRLLLLVSPRLSLAQQLLGMRALEQHATRAPQLVLQLSSPLQDALLVSLMGLPRLAALTINAPGYRCQGGLEQLASCGALSSLDVALGGCATGQAELQELLGQASGLRGLRSLSLHAPAGACASGAVAPPWQAPQLPPGLLRLALCTPAPLPQLPPSLARCSGLTCLELGAGGPEAYGGGGGLAALADAVARLGGLRRLSLEVQSADGLALELIRSLAAGAGAGAGRARQQQLPRLQQLELQSRSWPAPAANPAADPADPAADRWPRLAALLPRGVQLCLQLGAPRWPLRLKDLEAAAAAAAAGLGGGPDRGAASQAAALTALARLPCLSTLALHADCVTTALAAGVAGLVQLTRLRLCCGCFLDAAEAGGCGLPLGQQQDGDRQPGFPGLGQHLRRLTRLADLELGSSLPSHALRTGCFAALQGLGALTRLVCDALFELDAGLDAGAPGFQLPASMAQLALGRSGSSNWSDNWWESGAFAAQLAALPGLQRLEVGAAGARLPPALPWGLRACERLHPPWRLVQPAAAPLRRPADSVGCDRGLLVWGPRRRPSAAATAAAGVGVCRQARAGRAASPARQPHGAPPAAVPAGRRGLQRPSCGLPAPAQPGGAAGVRADARRRGCACWRAERAAGAVPGAGVQPRVRGCWQLGRRVVQHEAADRAAARGAGAAAAGGAGRCAWWAEGHGGAVQP